MSLVLKCGHLRNFFDFRRSWILPGWAGVSGGKRLGRTWILPGMAGLRLGQRRFVLTRSNAEGVGGFRLCSAGKSHPSKCCHPKVPKNMYMGFATDFEFGCDQSAAAVGTLVRPAVSLAAPPKRQRFSSKSASNAINTITALF